MSDGIETQRITDRRDIPPELIWSKYSIIQHAIFWLLALGAWHGLHLLAGWKEQYTLPVWRYVSRVRFYFGTSDFERMVIIGVITGFVLLGFILLTDYLFALIKGHKPSREVLRNYYLLPRTNKQSLIAMLLGVNAGIFEEIFFRGGLYTLFYFLSGSVILGVVVTSAIFALLHAALQGLRSTIWIFAVGIVLNVMVLYTDTYIAAMACHITVNIGNLFLIPALFEEDLEELILEDKGLAGISPTTQ
ncbi:MAG: CPBP family intramembrane metalloprotease [Candidatus Marinimicrobia bacterium]|nr:CPBP family intramembrane metalloprotease [Candidatus Neomarinimicrobiota bacterium]MCF7827983.1 CPBP family intramembrane metalloprotease [Candidatus Neomarinimicrobiota bacterium]MCF7879262.1 CPBP family intramembrane metalloprotease [Candidatus Neomarinimicrobiota bacterium]